MPVVSEAASVGFHAGCSPRGSDSLSDERAGVSAGTPWIGVGVGSAEETAGVAWRDKRASPASCEA